MQLYLICGHGGSPYDPGACGYGMEEAACVRELAKRIKHYGGDRVVILDPSRNWYADRGLEMVNLPVDAQIAELHMDSADGNARGAHVIYCGRLEPDAYDIALANFISSIFPGRANNLHGRTDLRNPNLAANRGFSYRLIENGFISSWEDLNVFWDRMDDIAKGYLDVFGIPHEDAVDEPVVEQPEEKPAKVEIEVDGWWGKETTKALQRYFGITVDGVVSSQYAAYEKENPGLVGGWDWVRHPNGSPTVKKIQELVGADVDGILGPNTISAMQAYLGTPVDGEVWGPSSMVKEMQKRLNAGNL